MQRATTLISSIILLAMIAFVALGYSLRKGESLIILAHPQNVTPQSITTTAWETQTAPSPMLPDQMALASIIVTKTVGIESACATGDVVTVTAGSRVTYCYMVQNIGSVTLTQHTVTDDKIGTVRYTIPLPPGPDASSVAFFTAEVPIAVSTINTVTWIASNDDGDTATATDAATVLVPAIDITHTVAASETDCALSHIINVVAGTSVVHCYSVRNTGPVTLAIHDAVDSRLGAVKEHWHQVLPPDTSLLITAADIATETTSSILTWTASVNDQTSYAWASDEATIRVAAIQVTTTVGADLNSCATTTVISVTVGTDVKYCYTILNTGGITHTLFDVSDTFPGRRYENLQYSLVGNATMGFTVNALVTSTQINTVTWLAYGIEPFTATATSSATVNALSRLELTAYYDVTPGGDREFLEAPEPGITVTIHMPSGAILTGVTNRQGTAAFDDLPPGGYTLSVGLTGDYSLRSDVNLGPLNMTAPNIYTITLPLNRPPETDSDGDGAPDYLEGAGDNDFDDIPNYLDTTQLLYLAWVVR